MKAEIIVKEAMKVNPLTCDPNMTIREVAQRMRERKVGSSIVVRGCNQPIGIITESDILKKVVAEGKDANKVLVKEVMSTPLVSIDPYASLEDAMKVMNKHNIRRLPVMEKGRLVGIITEKDIFRISPALIEIRREWSMIESSKEEKDFFLSGKCEGCGKFSTDLMEVDGVFLCESCREK
ncbi:MAG: CBS domain-containing protein [Thermoplasmata archaeon]|nr:CBS domain-containing protein [Thermoplasmata archaeon]